MSEIKAIVYLVKPIPDVSLRYLPRIETVVYVKSDLYEQWKRDPNAVNFEDVLEDPQVPVLFKWSWGSQRTGFIKDNRPPLEERETWYGRGVSDLEIAKVTAQKGMDGSMYSDYRKPQ